MKTASRRIGIPAALLLATTAFVASGCAPRSTTVGGSLAAELHPMRADQLHEAMRGFDAAVRTKVPAETDAHDRWEGVFPQIADAAAGLEESARRLAGRPPGKLELPDRGRFASLAKSLETRAAELKDAAARGDADAVELARGALGRACRDCHERFRPDSPGVPDAFAR
jgi:hypothetical protein